MLSRVIRSGIQTGERDEGICALQGGTLESVHQCSADDRADADLPSYICFPSRPFRVPRTERTSSST